MNKLEKELKIVRKMTPDISEFEDQFNCNVTVGDALKDLIQTASQYKTRDCIERLDKYINGPTVDKVCVVYGLRRAGKTTMLKQEMLSFSEVQLKHTVYIKARTTDTISSINKDIKKLEKAGYKYLFIDEATLMEDFIDGAALFSDVYAATGMKIVLSGDDSLGFYFAEGQELYDRAITIHTTVIMDTLKKILDIKEKEEQEIGVTEVHVNEIKQYLKHLDLTETLEIDFIQGSREEYTIFTQPGMRFCQAQALVYSLMKDDQIKNLDAKTIQLITDKIIEGVLGHMLEDIVIFETKRELAKNSRSGKRAYIKSALKITNMTCWFMIQTQTPVRLTKSSTQQNRSQISTGTWLTKTLCRQQKNVSDRLQNAVFFTEEKLIQKRMALSIRMWKNICVS